jgi:hypothetical protein
MTFGYPENVGRKLIGNDNNKLTINTASYSSKMSSSRARGVAR